MPASATYFVNGAFVHPDDAKISILDLSILRGLGIFDFLRTYQQKPFHLRDHLLRLHYSAKGMGLELPHTLEEIEEIVYKILEKNPRPESNLKIVVTGGVSEDQFYPGEQCHFFLFSYPVSSYPESHYQEGIKVATTSIGRILPMIKSNHYAPAIVSLKGRRMEGFQEILYLNAEQEILEGSTSNFFAVKKGKLITPCSDQVLFGITREIILRLSQGLCPVELRPISLNELEECDEAFVSSSTREIMPVSHVESTRIGQGKPGPITLALMQRFREYTQREEWVTLNIPRHQSIF